MTGVHKLLMLELAQAGMPAELPLLTDNPDFISLDEDYELDEYAEHESVLYANGLSPDTPVDTFMHIMTGEHQPEGSALNSFGD